MAVAVMGDMSGIQSTSSIRSGVSCRCGADGLAYHNPKNYGLSFFAIVVCGTLNNFAYCLISGAGQDVAKHFGAVDQMTLLTGVMNASALLATVISTRYLVYLPFSTRVKLTLLLTAIAYAGVAACATTDAKIGFWISSLMSVCAGMAQVFGEVTNLSFLKNFPPALVGGWGAGTGIAGIAGGGIYPFLREVCGLSMTWVFSLCVPLCFCHWAAFSYLHREVTANSVGPRLARAVGGIAPRVSSRTLHAPLEHDTAESFQDVPVATSLPATCENMKAAIRASGSIMFNLVAVYFLEYTIWPGLADRETLCAGSTAWNSGMWVCYNVGVTLSRFSVSMFRIRRVWILTAFQVVNVFGWFVEVYTGVVRDSLPNNYGYIIMAIWMVFVGLCGGATYGNCMHLFNTQEGIPEGLRELGVNLGFVMLNMGVSTATLGFTLFDSTFLSKEVLYPGGCH